MTVNIPKKDKNGNYVHRKRPPLISEGCYAGSATCLPHHFIFRIKNDRYGICKKCGCEVLT